MLKIHILFTFAKRMFPKPSCQCCGQQTSTLIMHNLILIKRDSKADDTLGSLLSNVVKQLFNVGVDGQPGETEGP